jgi:hypothetical protein
MELAYKTAREMSRVLTYVAAASTNPDPPPLHRAIARRLSLPR